jgi:hypothetical protein
MARTIDQIRASKLPSNMMQFAARGALSVPPAENIEILVYLAKHNKVFGDLARMTLAGWDEKASLVAAADPESPPEVLDYLISGDNLRPVLLPQLLENPSVTNSQLAKLSISATRPTIEVMVKSPRVRASLGVLDALKSNPYVKPEEAKEIGRLLSGGDVGASPTVETAAAVDAPPTASATPEAQSAQSVSAEIVSDEAEVPDEVVATYISEHADEVAAEEGKPFQAIGGIVELLGANYFPVSAVAEIQKEEPAPPASVAAAVPVPPRPAVGSKKGPPPPGVRENALQKINRLDVKGRIQLALKGNKEERSLLIRDGTKIVALAVLEAPKLSDGEVEKFAGQKNVLEAVLRQIPLKRRFMKNYIVVRNLVGNPRTPLDIGLALMKNLMLADLKHLSTNKEISETIRKLALKTYKQKLDASQKK